MIRQRVFFLLALMLAAMPVGAKGAVIDDLIALCTAPDTMSLDPHGLLKRVAFRGGKPYGQETNSILTFDITEGSLTFGQLKLTEKGDAWQVDKVMLLFTPDDAIPLAPLEAALTKAFGAPQDATTGNTMLIWRGQDRAIQVTADAPAEAKKLVYGVIVARR